MPADPVPAESAASPAIDPAPAETPANDRPPRALWIAIAASAIVLFACASVRHFLLQSTAFDLGIYDQVAYLMGRGLPPYATVSDMHHMGNHAAYSFFLVGGLYAIAPSIYWLFAVQAVGLALGAWPAWALAKQAGLNPRQSLAIAGLYLLYPLIFNVNLFDFHPEVMGIAAFLGAIWAARAGRVLAFAAGLLFFLGCKAVLSLTVAATGVWLLAFERRWRCGAIALGLGVGWFLLSTQVAIPAFNQGEGHDAIGRYAYLGDSVLEVGKNLFLRPGLVLARVFSGATLTYLALLLGPVLWWLLPGRLAPLVGALPAFGLNLLSDVAEQRDLVHQYSLPILPFLVLAAIAGLKAGYPGLKPGLLKTAIADGRAVWVWSAIGFLVLAKYGYFGSIYLAELDTWAASRAAIARVAPTGGVLASANLVPHLSHRAIVRQTVATAPPPDWPQYDWVLLDSVHPGWGSTPEFVAQLRAELTANPEFLPDFDRDGVVLFRRAAIGRTAPPLPPEPAS